MTLVNMASSVAISGRKILRLILCSFMICPAVRRLQLWFVGVLGPIFFLSTHFTEHPVDLLLDVDHAQLAGHGQFIEPIQFLEVFL